MFNIKWKETQHNVKSALVVFAAEVLGTGMLMFLGCMGGVKGFKDKDTPSVQGACVFGMTVASIIQMLGHVSGAHLNPVVTLAAFIWGSISLPTAILYFIAQILGALAGFAILTAVTPDELLNWGVMPNDTGAFCTTTPAPGLSTAQAFVGEFLATGMLILLCCGCWDSRNTSLQDSVAIKFGIFVAAISIAQGPYTGASMNPARTLAPSIIFDKWDRHWIYWVATMAAGIVVPVVYRICFMGSLPNPESNSRDLQHSGSRTEYSQESPYKEQSEYPVSIVSRNLEKITQPKIATTKPINN